MRVPSKRARQMTALQSEQTALREERRTALRSAGAVDARATHERLFAIEEEIAQLEAAAAAGDDEFTCIKCGQDYSALANDGDFLVISFKRRNGDDKPTRLDYGVPDARRMKICPQCLQGFAIQPEDYFAM